MVEKGKQCDPVLSARDVESVDRRQKIVVECCGRDECREQRVTQTPQGGHYQNEDQKGQRHRSGIHWNDRGIDVGNDEQDGGTSCKRIAVLIKD